jgi:hypothetical protein
MREASARAAQERGRVPCKDTSGGAGEVTTVDGHEFSWGACLKCSGVDPRDRVRPPSYDLSLADAQAILKETSGLDPSPHLRAGLIVKAVATHFGVTPASLKEHRRSRSHTRPRHIAMFLVYRDTELSYPEVGRMFSRDHSTVIAAVRKITTQLEDEAAGSAQAGPSPHGHTKTANQVEAVRSALRSQP